MPPSRRPAELHGRNGLTTSFARPGWHASGASAAGDGCLEGLAWQRAFGRSSSYLQRRPGSLRLTEVLGEVLHDLAEELGREAVAHPRNELQLRARDRNGRRLAARGRDERIGLAVDDECGSSDVAERLGAIWL